MNIYWPGTKIVKSRGNAFDWRGAESAINWRTLTAKTLAAQKGGAASLTGHPPVVLPNTYQEHRNGTLFVKARAR